MAITAARPGLKRNAVGAILTDKSGQVGVPALGVVVMAKYLALFGFTSEAIKQFVANPSDRAVVVRRLVESVGGSLECYYWMFGQYDGMAIVEMPDSQAHAAATMALISSGAFTHFETHELIEADDLTAIAERAREIAYQPPGARRAHRPLDTAHGVNPPRGARIEPVALMGRARLATSSYGRPVRRRAMERRS